MVPKINNSIVKRFQTHYQMPLNDNKLNKGYTLDDNGHVLKAMMVIKMRVKVAPKKILIAN